MILLILLVKIMLLKDPGVISSVLDFLSKKLDKFDDKENEEFYQKTKEILGIERMEGEDKMLFYNVKYKELDDKSLLQYINWENTRMSRQREELIDLSVKIANLNQTRRSEDEDENEDKVLIDSAGAIEEVINHFKSGLPSGVGLRDMVTQIKERYPWSSCKTIIMILVSLVTCTLGIGLFILDLTTDLEFSKEMFNKKNRDYDGESFNQTFSSFLSENGLTFRSCWIEFNEMKEEFDTRKNSTSNNINHDYYVVTGWIALWHCIQPFVATLIVFLSMNCCKGGKCSAPDQPAYLRDKYWWGMSSLFCCIPPLAYIGKLVPLPGLTNLYRFYLDVRCHIRRSKPEFRTIIVSVEEQIRQHEVLGEL